MGISPSADRFCVFADFAVVFRVSGPLCGVPSISPLTLLIAAACFPSPGPRHPSSLAYLSVLVTVWCQCRCSGCPRVYLLVFGFGILSCSVVSCRDSLLDPAAVFFYQALSLRSALIKRQALNFNWCNKIVEHHDTPLSIYHSDHRIYNQHWTNDDEQINDLQWLH